MTSTTAERIDTAIHLMRTAFPQQKQTIDAEALSAYEAARRTDYPIDDFSARLNALRGMCPDGCCGGVFEDGDEATLIEFATHYYVGALLARGIQKLLAED